MPSQLIPVVPLSLGESLASVALADEQGSVPALLDVSEINRYDLESLAGRLYGTISRKHPGVARLMDRGNCFLGGDVTFVQPLVSPHRALRAHAGADSLHIHAAREAAISIPVVETESCLSLSAKLV